MIRVPLRRHRLHQIIASSRRALHGGWCRVRGTVSTSPVRAGLLLRPLRRVVAAVEILVVFARVEWLLRTTRLPETCRRLRVGYEHDRPAAPLRAPSQDRLWRYLSGVPQVSAHWPFGDTCLRRCLVLGHLFASREPLLEVGVRRQDDGAIGAHSWLKFGNGVVLDPTSADYLAFAAPPVPSVPPVPPAPRR